MKQGISKKEFIKSLENTLKLTREGIEKLELVNEDLVEITFKGGYKEKINISCNSAMAIIKDIVKQF